MLPAGVEIAERLLTDQEQEGEIIVLSDGCFENIVQLQANAKVAVFGVGTQSDNLGITRYQVRRSLLDVVGYQVLVDVSNFSLGERSFRLELNLDNELVDVIPLTLAPGETVTRIMDYTSAGGGELVATLDAEDAFATDNKAIAVLPKRNPFPVILVTESNLFLKSVLESIPLVDLQIVADPPAVVPANGILVLDRKMPTQVPQGRVLVVNPQNDCDLWALGDPIPQPIVASVDPDSPLTQHLRLDNVLFPDARVLQFTHEFEPLIQDPLDQPLLSKMRRLGGRCCCAHLQFGERRLASTDCLSCAYEERDRMVPGQLERFAPRSLLRNDGFCRHSDINRDATGRFCKCYEGPWYGP